MFDPSAPHIIILLVVVLLLFGVKRLPGAAKSLGESMHIFKKSIHGEDENGQPMSQPGADATTPAAPVPPRRCRRRQPAAFTPSYDAVTTSSSSLTCSGRWPTCSGRTASPTACRAPPAPEAQHSQQPF